MTSRRKSLFGRVAEKPLDESPLFWLAIAASIVFFAFFNWAVVTAFSS
jgi:hypothetical protein